MERRGNEAVLRRVPQQFRAKFQPRMPLPSVTFLLVFSSSLSVLVKEARRHRRERAAGMGLSPPVAQG